MIKKKILFFSAICMLTAIITMGATSVSYLTLSGTGDVSQIPHFLRSVYIVQAFYADNFYKHDNAYIYMNDDVSFISNFRSSDGYLTWDKANSSLKIMGEPGPGVEFVSISKESITLNAGILGNTLSPSGWSGNSATANLGYAVEVADTEDATTYLTLVGDATGNKEIKTDESLTYDASTGILSATSFSGLLSASSVTLAEIGTASYNRLNDHIDSFSSAGRKTGGVITDATGGYIAVSAGTGYLRATDDDNAPLLPFDWPAPSNIEIPASSTRYIGVEYNAGTPRVVARTTWNWNMDSEFSLGRVINEPINGTDGLHIINNPWWVTDATGNILDRFRGFGRVLRDENIGGLVVGYTGTRNITVSGGTLWSNLNEHPIAAIDTSGADSVEAYWYKAGTGWQEADATQFSVTQYNDITQTTLQNIPANKYFNIWFYAEADDDELALVYPQAYYNTEALAEAKAAPSDLPSHMQQNGILIGRFICKTSTDTPVAVQTAWDNSFSIAPVTDHGNLTGLTDDDHTQYLRLDQTTPQTIGDTTNRLTKLWATDITVTNAITGGVTGNAGTVTNGIYTTSFTEQGSILSSSAASTPAEFLHGAAGDLLKSGGDGANLSWLTPATGINTWLATPSSANLATAVTDETGTGALVFGTSPEFQTAVSIFGPMYLRSLTGATQMYMNNYDTTSYSWLDMREAGVSKAGLLYVNSAYTTAARRNELEVHNWGTGDITFMINSSTHTYLPQFQMSDTCVFSIGNTWLTTDPSIAFTSDSATGSITYDESADLFVLSDPLDVAGTIEITSATARYQIGGQNVLWLGAQGSVSNIIVGSGGGALLAGSGQHTFVGGLAGAKVTTGTNSTHVGYAAGYTFTTENNNTTVGYAAGCYYTGTGNVMVGERTGYVGSGAWSIASNYNTMLGQLAGCYMYGGDGNVAVGYQAGYGNSYSSSARNVGDWNVFVGGRSGMYNTTGYGNVEIGYEAGYAIGTGFNNIMIGNIAGTNTTSGYGNIIVGASSELASGSNYNAIVIGYDTVGMGLNTAVYGNPSIVATYFYGDDVYIMDSAAGAYGDAYMAASRVGSPTAGVTTFVSSGIASIVGANTTYDTYNALAIKCQTATQLHLTTTGRVGIGDDTPSTALEVNGTVTATAFAGPASSATYSSGVLAVDNRDVKPAEITPANLKNYFTSLGGMTGAADTDYQDLLVIDTYTDNSAGVVNALTFDKSAALIKLWQANHADAQWTLMKTLAFTDSSITGNAATATAATKVTVAATPATEYIALITNSSGDQYIKADTDFSLNAATHVMTGSTFTAKTAFVPDAHDGAYLGSSATGFSDLFLATGAVITWGAASTPDATLTHSADLLTLVGANLTVPIITVTTKILPDANDGASLGDVGQAFSDMSLAEGGQITWDTNDVIVRQTGNVLSIEGTTSVTQDVASGSAVFSTDSDSLANGESNGFVAYGSKSGGGTQNRAAIMTYYSSATGLSAQACGTIALSEMDAGINYLWFSNGAILYTDQTAGNIGSTTGTIIGSQTSDIRLKKDIAPMKYGLAEIEKLNPISFKMKADESGRNKIGFSAQDVQKIIPEAVYKTGVEVENPDGTKTADGLGMEYVYIVPVLVNAIKEQQVQIDDLTKRLERLEKLADKQ